MSRRVLDPPGTLPHAATRLDPVGPLAPGERLLELEALVLGPRGDALRRPDGALALQHAAQERGGLPPVAADGALVGRLGDGRRVALLQRLAGLPAWVVGAGPWDGHAPVVPLTGHAVLPRSARPPDVDEEAAPGAAVTAVVAAWVAEVATAGSAPLVVLGTGDHAHVAATAAAAAGRVVVAHASGLGVATALRAAGVTVIADLGDGPADAVAAYASALGEHHTGCRALVLGGLPPAPAGTTGGAPDAPPAVVAGMLTTDVEVVGDVAVGRAVVTSGARVLVHPAPGWDAPWA